MNERIQKLDERMKNDEFLKGPKREIFGLRIFTQIRPIWIGDLGTRPKNPKK
jgi:hypothetical protein